MFCYGFFFQKYMLAIAFPLVICLTGRVNGMWVFSSILPGTEELKLGDLVLFFSFFLKMA